MPRRVEKVPNLWEPYMDGAIWEFTEDEMRGMPGFQPMTNKDGFNVGRTMIQWYIDGRYYVRFYDEADVRDDLYPQRLAGWID